MDESIGTTVGRRRRNLPLAIGLGVAIVAAGWTAVWAVARNRVLGEVETRLEALATRGVIVRCPERSVGGFPFRMELACKDPGLELADRGIAGSAAALRVVAQIWDPHLVIVELDGPGTSRDGEGEVSATWRSLRASLRWSTSGVERLSIAADGLDATVRPTGRAPLHLTAEHGEAHGRPSGEGHDLDLAVSLAAAALQVGGVRVGPPSADVSAEARLVGFLPPPRGAALPGFAARGGAVEPLKLSFAVGGLTVEGEGGVRLGVDGLLDGKIGLSARGLESLAGGGASRLGPELTTAVSAIALAGRPSGDPAKPGRRLDMTIEHGQVKIGRVSVGRLAPLFAAGS